jgi:hypothetical protein
MDGNNRDIQFWKQLYQFTDPIGRTVLIKPTVNNDQTGVLVADNGIQRVIFLARYRNVFKARRFKPPLYLRVKFYRSGQRQHPAHYSPFFSKGTQRESRGGNYKNRRLGFIGSRS